MAVKDRLKGHLVTIYVLSIQATNGIDAVLPNAVPHRDLQPIVEHFGDGLGSPFNLTEFNSKTNISCVIEAALVRKD